MRELAQQCTIKKMRVSNSQSLNCILGRLLLSTYINVYFEMYKLSLFIYTHKRWATQRTPRQLYRYIQYSISCHCTRNLIIKYISTCKTTITKHLEMHECGIDIEKSYNIFVDSLYSHLELEYIRLCTQHSVYS